MKFHLDCYLDEQETSDSQGGEEKRYKLSRMAQRFYAQARLRDLCNASAHNPYEQTVWTMTGL